MLKRIDAAIYYITDSWPLNVLRWKLWLPKCSTHCCRCSRPCCRRWFHPAASAGRSPAGWTVVSRCLSAVALERAHTHTRNTHTHTHTPVGPSPVPTKNMSEQQSHNGEQKAQFSWYLCFQLTLRKKIIQKKCFTIIKCSAWLIKSWLWRMERISRTIIDLLYLKTFTVYFFCRI